MVVSTAPSPADPVQFLPVIWFPGVGLDDPDERDEDLAREAPADEAGLDTWPGAVAARRLVGRGNVGLVVLGFAALWLLSSAGR